MVARFFAISDSGGTVSTFLMRILFTGSHSGALTDYQSLHTITYESEMQADFDDIRFVTDSGVHIPYWIESKTDSTTAEVWIKSGIVDGNTPIWMYYGNSGLSSGSSSSDVFIQYHGSASSNFVDTLLPGLISNVIFEAKVRVTSASHIMNWGIAETSANSGGDRMHIKPFSGDTDIYARNSDDGVGTLQQWNAYTFTTDQWYRLLISNDGTTIHYYFDENEIGTGATTNLPDENMGLQFNIASGTGEQEFSFARKYAASEPTWAYGTPQHARTGNMIL